MNITIVAYYYKPGSYSLTLYPGRYRFECWGASGGIAAKSCALNFQGGNGAFVSGDILLKTKRAFYLFVGGKGQDGSTTKNTAAPGGYNGGGNGGKDTNDNDGTGAGGGASDIRLINGTFNDITSLISRIIVAAGGSGAACDNYGAPGGGLYGFNVIEYGKPSYSESETNQTNGYSLGLGGDGRPSTYVPSSGGGGGYYGGFAYNDRTDGVYHKCVSSSGNSFISGHSNCNAVDVNGTHTGSSIHYSELYFENTVMFTGNETFESPQYSPEVGHYGDGFIRVMMLGVSHQCMLYTRVCTSFNFLYSMVVLFST
jgi:hypothetical protein